ncbi:protein ALTERED PHOSPHATE STARVATION RESPONSE 1-like [Tasmannia lanceolata]|uniref:protein ALTERED PHOSPHATE STARVATION RESPONSE 1-like n=1 Tax=Tasmannia lanceolata TaxID=3420 RepID=UPI004062B844
MGGCVASKLEQEDQVVSLCRERKRLLRSAVERRYALADSHCKYMYSLNSVASAIRLFVARRSSPFFITLPPPCSSSMSHTNPCIEVLSDPVSDPPALLRHTPSESTTTQEAVVCESDSDSESDSGSDPCSDPEREGDGGNGVYGYYFSGMPVPPSPPRSEFGWDFFNPFNGVLTMGPGLGPSWGPSWDEDLRAVREKEGIPELEEERDEGEEEEKGEGEVVVMGNNEGVEVVKVGGGNGGNVSGREQKGLTVIDTPVRERELLDALKDVEDHFIRAYHSGKDVSRMLEANRVNFQSGLEEIKENSSKLIHAITWHRSTSQSSSYKSHLASSSKEATWSEYKNELFDDCGGMESGSHSSTLGRLYAWEKKLYDEVKAGDRTRRAYERKCSQLRNQDARGDDSRTVDKTRAAVKDLYTRIWVAIRTAESISKRIQNLRDEELQPQIIELLKGLVKIWKVMLESHETQNQIMFEVKTFTCNSYGWFSDDSHRHAIIQLEAELQNWRTCFNNYIAAQKSYVEALSGWLSKFIVPEVEFYSRDRSSILPYRVGAPPLVVICHDWLNSLGKLPDNAVAYSIKSFSKDIRTLWVQQGEEQQQKKKVDSLAKELDRRVLAFQRTENRVLESKLSELKSEPDVRQGVEYLAGRKDLLDMFRNRLESEKAKYHNCMQETQRVMLNGFQTGLSSVFESLTEFSKASLNMYSELVTYSEKSKGVDESGNPSPIEGSEVGSS